MLEKCKVNKKYGKLGSCLLKSGDGQFSPLVKMRLTIHQVLELNGPSTWRSLFFYILKKALQPAFHIPQEWIFEVEEKPKVRRVRRGIWLAFNSLDIHLAPENVSMQRPKLATVSVAQLSNKILRKPVTVTHLDLALWSNMTRIQVGLWFLIPLACLCLAKEEVRDGKLCKFILSKAFAALT